MIRPRPPKKGETLEIRLPYATKTAFMARCRGDGRTASQAVRRFIEEELGGAGRPLRRTRLLGWLAAALAGFAVGAVAAPSLAHTTPISRAAFERLDRNHDGQLSFEEFRGG